MTSWIKDGKIINEDFAYLCGSLVAGLWVGSYTKKNDKDARPNMRLSLTTADNSYASYLGYVIKKLTNLNSTVREYDKYETKVEGRTYKNPRTVLQLGIPLSQIDFWTTLKNLKYDLRELNDLLLNSDKQIQKRFLQAIFDAKVSPVIRKKNDLDFKLFINDRQFPIITSVLTSYDITHTLSPKEKPKYILIQNKTSVDKIIEEIGFNSKRVMRKIEDYIIYLYDVPKKFR